MYTTIRIYRGAPGLADTLVNRVDEIRDMMKQVNGFESYQLLRSYGGAVSVTSCRDQEATEETNRVAAEWLRKNLPAMVTSPPEIIQGETVMSFSVAHASV